MTHHALVVGDSRHLDDIADESVHLVLTSPPYPMIEMWDRVFRALDPEVGVALDEGRARDAWELEHRTLDQVWDNVARVLVPGGHACVNVGDATRKLGGVFRLHTNHARVIQALETRGLDSLPPVLWRKPTNAPTKFMGSGMLPGAYVTLEHEHILIHRKGGPRIYGRAQQARRRASAFFWEERNQWFSDLWELKGARQPLATGTGRGRSAAFPLELALRLVAMYSVREDLVLDPFVGTGTTTLAAAALGRSSRGVDVDPGMIRAAGVCLLESADRLNTWTRERLERHHTFVKDSKEKDRKLGYHNTPHDCPVMTAQEKDLSLQLVDAIRLEGPGAYSVSYRSP